MRPWSCSGLLSLCLLWPVGVWAQPAFQSVIVTATAATPPESQRPIPIAAQPAAETTPAKVLASPPPRATPPRRAKSAPRKSRKASSRRKSTVPLAPVLKLVAPLAKPVLAPALSPIPSGWRLWDVGPPTESESESETEPALDSLVVHLDAALWPVVRVVGLVFVLLRLLSLLVARRARRGRSTFVLIRRGWIFVEGTAWLLTGVWAIAQLSSRQSAPATLLAMLVFGLMVALSWNGLRDVTAGLMLAAERPFALGDHVCLQEGEGRVRAFRSRVLELESPDGIRIRVPYRRVLGTARVRKGGRQTTHVVPMELSVPDFMEPQEAIKAARELACSSPWAVLGASPRIELLAGAQGPVVKVTAFAFAEDAQPLLHADLLSGWRQECARKA